MEDDDYLALIEILAAELREIGAFDIADEENYRTLDSDLAEARLLDPQTRLIEMLRAFERRLKVEDRETFFLAMVRIQQFVRGSALESAVVLTTPSEVDRQEIELGSAPDLAEVRVGLNRLISELSRIDRGFPPLSR